MNLKKKISLVKNLPLWFLLQQQYKNIKKKKKENQVVRGIY